MVKEVSFVAELQKNAPLVVVVARAKEHRHVRTQPAAGETPWGSGHGKSSRHGMSADIRSPK